MLLWLFAFHTVDALECFDCTNYPDGIVCSTTASCQTQAGCYYGQTKEPKAGNETPYWVSSCVNKVKLANYQTSCYTTPQNDMICVCFNEFCNSPVEINNAMELEFSPFEEIPLLPWALATPAPPTTTTTKAPMVTFKTIPTTLVTKPTTTTTTMSTTTKTTPRLTTAALVTEPGPGFVAKEDKTTLGPTKLDLTKDDEETTKSDLNQKEPRSDSPMVMNETAQTTPDEYLSEEEDDDYNNAKEKFTHLIVFTYLFILSLQ